MAAETDGRSESASSLSSPTNGSLHGARVELQHGHLPDMEPETSRGDRTCSGVGPLATPLFASPFMTPYMPQQNANSVPDSAQQPNFQPILPGSEAYFLQNVQYQEFMQQYLNLVAAATSQTALDLSRQGKMSAEEAQRAFTGSLQMAMQQMQQNLCISSSFSNNFVQPTTSSSVNATAASSPALRNRDPTIEEKKGNLRTTRSSEALFDSAIGFAAKPSIHEEQNDEKSSRSSLPNANDMVFLRGASGTSFQGSQNLEEQALGEACDTKEAVLNGEPSTSTENGPQEREAAVEGSSVQETFSLAKNEKNSEDNSSVPCSSSSEKHVESASQTPSSSRQISEDLLIKKQMNEIDKQINRRMQNKNIRKSALPFGPSAAHENERQHQTPSLNQLKDSFGLSQNPEASGSGQFSSQNNFMQQSSPFNIPAGPQMNPVQQFPQTTPFPYAATIPQMAQSMSAYSQGPIPAFPPTFPFAAPFFPGAQQQVTPQMAAAFLQQLQQSQQHFNVQPSSASRTESDDAKQQESQQEPAGKHHWIDEDSWNEMDARHKSSNEQSQRRTSTSDQAQQALESGENGEPVWVMRESYLKRIQREEDRSHEETDAQRDSENTDSMREEIEDETDQLLSKNERISDEAFPKKNAKKEVIVHEPAVLIEGVLFRARYLGSTQLICEGRPTKTSRMLQAQEAVARVKAPEGEVQPSTDIDLFISTEKIMVLNTDLQDILMDHALRTISYIADIGDLVVLMARRISQSASEEGSSSEDLDSVQRTPKVICHVFESEEASFIAQSIGQAFQVAYVEFLRANGIDDPSYLREIDYQEVLNSQELLGEELEMFSRKETQKDVVVPKKAGEPLGVVVVESGWGSMLPTVVIANLQPGGPAARCNQLNIGDQIIAINGVSLVGLPLASAQRTIKGARSSTAVKLTVVSTPPVVEVRIKRPDTKYQLGFSVQNGVICSLLRGGIAERGGIRVGHRIIEINGHSVVAIAHDKIVKMLATAIGEIHMKTMPTSMFRLLTGQEVPNYI